MLKKIIKIQNIGSFRNLSAGGKGDITLRKLTLIYGENSQGKTMLSAILRSLKEGQAPLIAERKTLGTADNSAFAELQLDGKNCKFRDSKWTNRHANFSIFDSAFINENVYSGDYVGHEHKKNLYQAVIGDKETSLAKEIEKLSEEIKKINPSLKEKEEILKEKSRVLGMRLNDYLNWKKDSDLDGKIQQKESEAKKHEKAVIESENIQWEKLLEKISAFSLPHNFSQILAKNITNIAADAEEKIQQQIFRHKMEQEGEPWLSQGLGYVGSNHQCPFCEQSLQDNNLIEAYRLYFNEKYQNFKEEIYQLGQQLSNTMINEKDFVSHRQTIIKNNASRAKFWKEFIAIDLPTPDLEDYKKKYAELRKQCLALLEKKKANLTNPVETDDILMEVELLEKDFVAYNKKLDKINLEISNENLPLKKKITIRMPSGKN